MAITRILNNATPCENDIVVITKPNGIRHPYLYMKYKKPVNGVKYGWTPLYGNTEGENIVFADGESLLDKLNANTNPGSESNLAIDPNAFTLYYDEDDSVIGFTLKDFGLKYYVYNADARNYESVGVDATHPWPDGLVLQTIRVNGKKILGWAEVKPSDELTELKTTVTRLSNTIGKVGRPSTGLIKKIEDLENNHIKEIKLGEVILRPVANRIEFPIFNGKNNGAVPKPASSVPKDYVLNAEGFWVDPSDLVKLEWEKY